MASTSFSSHVNVKKKKEMCGASRTLMSGYLQSRSLRNHPHDWTVKRIDLTLYDVEEKSARSLTCKCNVFDL